MRRGHTLLSRPRPLRQYGVTPDTIAIVPARLVPYKTTSQAIANDLPRGAVLLVLSTADTPETRLLQRVAQHFEAKGRHVTTISDASVTEVRREDNPMTTSTPLPASDTSMELPPFTSYVHLVSIDPTANRYRFYRLQWHPTLWDDRALLCVWGRIGTLGQVRVLHHAQTPEALTEADRTLRVRLRHGYQIVDWH